MTSSAWLLVIMVYHGGVAIQEFPTKAACQTAAEIIKQERAYLILKQAVCVPKG